MTLGVLGGVGYVVGKQLTSLANDLPSYQENIESKLNRVIKPGEQSAADKLRTMANQVTAKMEKTAPRMSGSHRSRDRKSGSRGSRRWRSSAGRRSRINSARPSGPYLEFLGVGSFVLILVLFMLMGRKELSDRIVGLFGDRQVSLTTRTMQEIGQRITRYLATFALVNSGFGLVIGVGLQLIGVPFAVLWGCLAGLLRFIPYVGPAVAFVLPLVFSFAHFPGWAQPLEVVALFAVVETALNSYLEPVIYGKTTGVSALGLLVAAMFWTWLWGTMGLLLSTPLTVCLAVLGKYVPSLSFFAALLGEEVELEPDVRFYQRLVALDRDGATEVVDNAVKQMPRVEVFDRVLVPALSRAERDFAHEELNDVERAFVWQVVGNVLDGLEGTADFDLSTAAPSGNGSHCRTGQDGDRASVSLVGVAVEDTSDVLILRMLAQLLSELGPVTPDPRRHRLGLAPAPGRAGGRVAAPGRDRLSPPARGLDDGLLPRATAPRPLARPARSRSATGARAGTLRPPPSGWSGQGPRMSSPPWPMPATGSSGPPCPRRSRRPWLRRLPG